MAQVILNVVETNWLDSAVYMVERDGLYSLIWDDGNDYGLPRPVRGFVNIDGLDAIKRLYMTAQRYHRAIMNRRGRWVSWEDCVNAAHKTAFMAGPELWDWSRRSEVVRQEREMRANIEWMDSPLSRTAPESLRHGDLSFAK